MQNRIILHKTIRDIQSVSTAHGVGEKRVLLSKDEINTPITQIAKTVLREGVEVEKHAHKTMDEHFIFLRGKCRVITMDDSYFCEAGQYLFIPAGVPHRIIILTDTELITVGVVAE